LAFELQLQPDIAPTGSLNPGNQSSLDLRKNIFSISRRLPLDDPPGFVAKPDSRIKTEGELRAVQAAFTRP
jgi:hypothetical protein